MFSLEDRASGQRKCSGDKPIVSANQRRPENLLLIGFLPNPRSINGVAIPVMVRYGHEQSCQDMETMSTPASLGTGNCPASSWNRTKTTYCGIHQSKWHSTENSRSASILLKIQI